MLVEQADRRPVVQPAKSTLSVELMTRVEAEGGLLRLGFRLLRPADSTFRAGQYVSLSLPEVGEASRSFCFSIASAARQLPELWLVVRAAPNTSPGAYLRRLQVGQQLEFSAPTGGFVLDEQHAGDVVFCVTGTGASAVVAMLHELADREEPGQRHVFWGLRSERDVAAFGDVEALCVRARAKLGLYLSQADPDWRGARGRILEPVLAALPQLRDPTFYLVGHAPMVRDLRVALLRAGVDAARRIRHERHLA